MSEKKVINSVGYEVFVGKQALAELDLFVKKKNYSRIFILCDENTFKYCLPELLFHCESLQECELLEIESGEENKNLGICSNLFSALTESGADRNS
ncbi:MAG: 3-dehydroquinate synthase, partial [Bacteroidia bacterium]|nr:3-dehydroquinate synthase [Bacteroidia bacterium]